MENIYLVTLENRFEKSVLTEEITVDRTMFETEAATSIYAISLAYRLENDTWRFKAIDLIAR